MDRKKKRIVCSDEESSDSSSDDDNVTLASLARPKKRRVAGPKKPPNSSTSIVARAANSLVVARVAPSSSAPNLSAGTLALSCDRPDGVIPPKPGIPAHLEGKVIGWPHPKRTDNSVPYPNPPPPYTRYAAQFKENGGVKAYNYAPKTVSSDQIRVWVVPYGYCKPCGKYYDSFSMCIKIDVKSLVQYVCLACRAEDQSKNNYGQSRAKQMKKQNNTCPICKNRFVLRGEPGWNGGCGPRCPCQDHCHKSNVNGAVLCMNCNKAEGMMNSDPDAVLRLHSYIINNRH